MFEIEAFQAWVNLQPLVVGVGRASRFGLYAFKDDSPVARWVSDQLGVRVTLLRGVRELPLQRKLRMTLPDWVWVVDAWCNQHPLQPIRKDELLSLLQQVSTAPPERLVPGRRRPWLALVSRG